VTWSVYMPAYGFWSVHVPDFTKSKALSRLHW
jgi:hypothetical protein